jgi:SpoVK/Ycf46/Vps4 family AAA+-type ATPase
MDWKKHLDDIVRCSLTEDSNGISIADWASVAFRLEALETDKTVYEFSYDGAVEKEQHTDFIKAVEQLKKDFRMVESAESTVPKWRRGKKQDSGQLEFKSTFISDSSVIKLSFDGKESSVAVQSFDREKAIKVIDLFSPLLKKKKERQGRACTLLKEQSIYVSDLGAAGSALERENYVSSVVEDYDFLVKDLSAEDPYGRLVILDGPPGTGKTYFVRALINDIENSIFLIVPATLVAHISDPSFMPAIIDLHEEEEVPIILVLEDADVALLPRSTDNMSQISDLLNFADGIVGNIIDFRIIATTNAKKMDIEPALLRKGRLSKHVHIGKLPAMKAKNVFYRILGTPEQEEYVEVNKKLSNDMTLADVW